MRKRIEIQDQNGETIGYLAEEEDRSSATWTSEESPAGQGAVNILVGLFGIGFVLFWSVISAVAAWILLSLAGAFWGGANAIVVSTVSWLVGIGTCVGIVYHFLKDVTREAYVEYFYFIWRFFRATLIMVALVSGAVALFLAIGWMVRATGK